MTRCWPPFRSPCRISSCRNFGAIFSIVTMVLLATRANGLATAGPQQTNGQALQTSSAYSDEFQKVWQTVNDKFWDSKLNGVDWKRVGDTYRARLPEVKSRTDFSRLINQMLGELHASHMAYANSDDFEFYMLPAVMSRDMEGHQAEHGGLMGYQSGTEFVVTAVLDGGPAAKAGVLSGDHILSADGEPFTTAGSFRGKEGKAVELSIRRDASSSPIVLSVVPKKQNLLRAFLNATRSSVRTIKYQGKNMGYIHLWTMANDTFKDLLESTVTNNLSATDGLILDLRDGFGGNPFGYADVFTRPDVRWQASFRSGMQTDTHTGYSRPMVVLINAGTRSAKEFLSYQLKTTQRATLIGKPTAGAFLGAGAFTISADGILELPIQGLKVDGVKLEANGVTPNISVDAKYPYSERDEQLRVAEQTLAKRIDEKASSRPKNGTPNGILAK